MFLSASLGILPRNEDKFYSIIGNQLLLGLSGGFIALLFFSKFPYRIFRTYALPIFIMGLVLTALVFVPGVGFEHGGARRWIELFGFSLQPSELLKFAFVLYVAALFSGIKNRAESLTAGLLPFLGALGLVAILMLKQPDTGTFLIMVSAGFAIYFVAGAPWRYLLGIIFAGVIGLSFLILERPYLKDRILTFLDPTGDPYGASYQIQQSLIAIGSGEIFGRGLGQSIQKFNYLPEPAGDSIFAVIAEELGFVGSSALVMLFLFFMLRGYRIANRTNDPFGRLLGVGLITLITTQAFLNMGSLSGVFPLTGVPLTFVSHGGTALLVALAEVGIILSISRGARR